MSQKGGNATLTPKQEKFVQGLFTGMSQREAYKSAYDCAKMKDATIDKRASEIAQKGEIKGRLKELQENLAMRNTVSVEWVLNNLKEVVERCMQAEPVLIRDGDEWIESGEYQFAHSGANKSLELIGKHLGMFTDKLEHSGKIELPSITITK
jgi:phage terminase small subunit